MPYGKERRETWGILRIPAAIVHHMGKIEDFGRAGRGDIEAGFEENFGLKIISSFVMDMGSAVKNIEGNKVGGEKDQSSQNVHQN